MVNVARPYFSTACKNEARPAEDPGTDMKRALPCGLLLAAALTTFNLHAQISFGGSPLGTKAEKLGLSKAPVVRMPSVDVAALIAEDAAHTAAGVKGPFRFGYNHAVDLGTDNSGVWDTMPDGTRVWRGSIECPGALSINFEFGEYHVPEGAMVFVYNEAGDQLGGFTAESNGGAPSMGVTMLSGDRITVEYQEPAAVAGTGHLRITQVTHGYRDVMGLGKALGDSGACNNNTICPEGEPWTNEIAAVSMIVVGGSGLCTGTLLNNCAQDGTPYFLTANHCTQGENVSNWVFRFKWESPTCTPTANGPTNKTVSGSSLLLNNAGSDVALLQLNTTPPASYGVYYAGWDASGTTPTSQTCIHHPSGDIKKISFDNNSATQGSYSGAQCWHILAWDDGTTEPGSSGSGLWNQDHHLIGQLFGGQAQCSNNVNDYFGRFDVSYPLLDGWLGACSVLDGWDPNATPLGLDAQLLSINGIENLCNEGTLDPSITIKNNGTTTLTSVAYTYDVDGAAPTSTTWNGSLATGASTTIPLGSISPGDGLHTVHASCTSPNGGNDENPNNDSRTRDFSIASPGFSVTLHITTDDYGSETTWEILPSGGSTVLSSGGPYADTNGGTNETASLCLSAGCYDLHMMDGYGDGICCQYGNGDFEILGADNTVLLNGDGNFNDEVTNSFCVSGVGIIERSGASAFTVRPNPGTGTFTITWPVLQQNVDVRVMDATGRSVLSTRSNRTASTVLSLEHLPAGTYALQVTTNGQARTERLVIAR